MATENVQTFTDSNFEETVIKAGGPVLVDFWAEWCGPCRAIAPMVEELAVEFKGKLKVVKIDVDESTDVAARYRIQSIPTLMVFKGGQEVERVVGAVPKPMLLQRVKNHL